MLKHIINISRDIIALPFMAVMTISMIIAYLLGGKRTRKALDEAFLPSQDN